MCAALVRADYQVTATDKSADCKTARRGGRSHLAGHARPGSRSVLRSGKQPGSQPVGMIAPRGSYVGGEQPASDEIGGTADAIVPFRHERAGQRD
jgi:hypothetical protein